MLRPVSSYKDMNDVFIDFSYGFFGTICLALAIIVHINNNPDWYISAVDSIMLSLGIIKEDACLPLYTPLNDIKNAKNKHIVLNIKSLKEPVKEIKEDIIEDV
jgi:hypothetical protein